MELGRKKGEESLIKLAVIQMEPKIGQVKENVARISELIGQAVIKGANLVVLPELCNTGYVFNTREETLRLSEHIPDGSTPKYWIEESKKRGIYIVAGIAEKSGLKTYNSAVLVGPEGWIGTYRKLHLWYEEKLFFNPGDLGLPVFDVPFGRVGLIICYDLFFPEAVRILMLEGADIICNPTNWVPVSKPTKEQARWCMANHLAVANAQSNAVYVACADRVGIERGQSFEGRSIIVDSSGRPIAGPASREREEILLAEINVIESRRAKKKTDLNNIIGDRRVDVYDRMLGYHAI